MKYQVLHAFVDKETGKEYTDKDFYEGSNKERIKELSSSANDARMPLIKKIDGKGEKTNG